MPPKTANKVQYPVLDPGAEVVCPISQADGNKCRKRCLGEKRFRSMQEHIRRAHPEYYIAKLPATKESFDLMINTPPHEIPKPEPELPQDWSPPSQRREHGHPQSRSYYPDQMSLDMLKANGAFRRSSLLPAASAAAALAQLHYARPDGDWRNDSTLYADSAEEDSSSEDETPGRTSRDDPTLSAGQRLVDSHYTNGTPSSPYRSRAPAVQRVSHPKTHKPHTKRFRYDYGESRDYLRPSAFDRRAGSNEPSTAAAALMGKRWEDLLEAATSATEEDSREVTPLPASPFRSPTTFNRPSLTPMPPGSRQLTRAPTPLQRTVSPPASESAIGLGVQSYPTDHRDSTTTNTRHYPVMPNLSSHPPRSDLSAVPLSAGGASTSAPPAAVSREAVQIYCAGCRTSSALSESYACTECICGLCSGCVDALVAERARGRTAQCPRCESGGLFKLFQLDVR